MSSKTTVNTVLILGAGASKDFHPDMGTGLDLAEGILSRVTEEHLRPNSRYLSIILEKYNPNNINYEDRKKFRDDFAKHMEVKEWNSSIDAFLSNNKNEKFLSLGKFVVAFHIMGYEGASLQNYGKKYTWLYQLALKIEKKMQETGSLENLKIITFNYDRLVEDYLYRYFTRMGEWNKSLHDFLTDNIIHVYGSLGKLPWQDDKKFTVYGLDNNCWENMNSTMDNFELMYEERNNGKIKAQKKVAHRWLKESNRVYCLGFGFDNDNMGYLNTLSVKNTIISTARGLSDEQKKNVKNVNITFHDIGCHEFVKSDIFSL